jgi:hypothetical protein
MGARMLNSLEEHLKPTSVRGELLWGALQADRSRCDVDGVAALGRDERQQRAWLLNTRYANMIAYATTQLSVNKGFTDACSHR